MADEVCWNCGGLLDPNDSKTDPCRGWSDVCYCSPQELEKAHDRFMQECLALRCEILVKMGVQEVFDG